MATSHTTVILCPETYKSAIYSRRVWYRPSLYRALQPDLTRTTGKIQIMSQVSQLRQQLTHKINAALALQELGLLLRDSAARLDPSVASLMPIVPAYFNEEPSEVLRVLVNFTADSNDNRDSLLADKESFGGFWGSLGARRPQIDDVVLQRSMILISQFIHNADEDSKERWIVGLSSHGLLDWVVSYYGAALLLKSSENLLMPIEFLASIDKQYYTIELKDLIAGFQLTSQMIEGPGDQDEENEDVESLLHHAQVLYKLTAADDLPDASISRSILSLFSGVPQGSSQAVQINRNLFAAHGNISSHSSFDNWTDLETNVDFIMNDGNPYVVAACAISLGNCVSNQSSQAKLQAQIDRIASVNLVADRVLSTTFVDVVQYQGFHFFNNILDNALALHILRPQNESYLIRHTKVVVDNASYYKEVALLYIKFLVRLITKGLVEQSIDPAPFEETWMLLLPVDDSDELHLLLLQAYFSNCDTLHGQYPARAFDKLLTLPTPINAANVLHKLKTLAVIFHGSNLNELALKFGKDDLSDEMPILTSFLTDLRTGLLQESDKSNSRTLNHGAMAAGTSMRDALLNNAKFVAGVIYDRLKDVSNSAAIPVRDACTALLTCG